MNGHIGRGIVELSVCGILVENVFLVFSRQASISFAEV